ncbi:DUF91 domain-containing protein [Methanococcoides sp. SA1]|nr:DUF91 domain-containing protein [Methanococcoides sp. SA1]
MTDIRLFDTNGGEAKELVGSSVALEKSLQNYMEKNLDALLGVRFLASEYITGKTHGGRIDTLGIDENGCPVIIEYKRNMNENVINQGLFYLDWLMDHKAEFKLRVMESMGNDVIENIEWSSPRLLCIAGDFTKYDVHAVQQINRNIELIRYRKYGDEFLLLELINFTSSENNSTKKPSPVSKKENVMKTFTQCLEESDDNLKVLYDNLTHFIENLGDDIQKKTLKFYVAYRRLKNFACVEIYPNSKKLLVHVKINPTTIELEEGFTRDMRNIGHFGTGDLEIIIKSEDDLKKALNLIQLSYESS